MARGTAALDAAQPMIAPSCHTMRALRRHAKRAQQEHLIKDYENQLNSWWTWWSRGDWPSNNEIDREVLARIRSIEPCIRAQVLAQVRGDPHHSARCLVDAEIHTKSNGAKHYYPNKSFAQVTVKEIRQHQKRAQPRSPMDVDARSSLIGIGFVPSANFSDDGLLHRGTGHSESGGLVRPLA